MNLLLIRGLSREMRHWGDFASSLESSINGLNVHRLEMPGAGTKMNVSAPLTIRGYVDHLRAEFLALKNTTSGPWCCFRISMGAIVTLEWGRLYPNEFQNVLLSQDMELQCHNVNI